MERQLLGVLRGALAALRRRLQPARAIDHGQIPVSVTAQTRALTTAFSAVLAVLCLATIGALATRAAQHSTPAKHVVHHHTKKRSRCAARSGHRSHGQKETAKSRRSHRRVAKCPARRRPTTRGSRHGVGAPPGAGAPDSLDLPSGGGALPDAPVLTDAHCFQAPGPTGEATLAIEACGYPGFANTGVEPGVALQSETGTVVFDSAGWENTTTHEHGTGNWEGHRLKGEVLIEEGAKPVVLRNDEIYDEGACRSELCSVNPIDFIAPSGVGPSGFVFSHMRVGGSALRGEDVAQTCINDPLAGTYTAEYVKTIYCSGFKLNGGGELDHVYCPSNYEISGEHYECVTDQGNPVFTQPLRITDSTIFQPPPENFGEGAGNGAGPTSAVFLQAEYGPVGELILERDFLAGGSEAIMDESKAAQTELTVRQTRFARCLAASCPRVGSEELNGAGHGDGTGLQRIKGNAGDGHGWFEHVGLFSVLYPISGPAPTWQEDFYDDDLRVVSLHEAE